MNKVQEEAKNYAQENNFIPDGQKIDLQQAFIAGFKLVGDWINIWNERPPYYKSVNIMYERSEKDWSTTYDNITTAWLAVNDDGEYIWTIGGTDIILPDEVISKWKYITIE